MISRSPLLLDTITEGRIVHPHEHLHIFDMDGTLALTPGPSKTNRDALGRHTRTPTNPRGDRVDNWWGDHRTLGHPLKTKPIESTIKGYHAAKASPNSRVVVMTGRVDTPEMRDAVSRTLHKIGVKGHEHGHDLFLKPPGKGPDGKKRQTHDWKAEMLRRFRKQHPNLRHVHMWDDRPEHLDHFGEVLKNHGVKHTLNHVAHPEWEWNNKMPSTT